jgi:hypothetical protein
MQLSAVLLARALGFVDINDLNPRGRSFFPYLVPLIVSRFNFQQYPMKPDEFDESKGVTFGMGHTGESTIDKITVWNNGIGVDVRSSTTDAKNILELTLSWLRDEGYLEFHPSMINRWGYLSQITFFADINLDQFNPALRNLAVAVGDSVAQEQGIKSPFGVSGINIDFDRSFAQSPIALFTLQRRAEVPFTRNKFYSEAPLPTETHIRVIQQLEKDIEAQAK